MYRKRIRIFNRSKNEQNYIITEYVLYNISYVLIICQIIFVMNYISIIYRNEIYQPTLLGT